MLFTCFLVWAIHYVRVFIYFFGGALIDFIVKSRVPKSPSMHLRPSSFYMFFGSLLALEHVLLVCGSCLPVALKHNSHMCTSSRFWYTCSGPFEQLPLLNWKQGAVLRFLDFWEWLEPWAVEWLYLSRILWIFCISPQLMLPSTSLVLRTKWAPLADSQP